MNITEQDSCPLNRQQVPELVFLPVQAKERRFYQLVIRMFIQVLQQPFPFGGGPLLCL
jgi:hypothetical protein